MGSRTDVTSLNAVFPGLHLLDMEFARSVSALGTPYLKRIHRAIFRFSLLLRP